MRFFESNVIERIAERVSLVGKQVLEIGCGYGFRSERLRQYCKSLVGIDPDPRMIRLAVGGLNFSNLRFELGSAETLRFEPVSFDVALFSQCLHHIPPANMKLAIDNAVTVLGINCPVIFLEPCFHRSMYEAESLFDAGDGDESEAKRLAHTAMHAHDGLQLVEEFEEVEYYRLSRSDFEAYKHPKQNQWMLEWFLERHRYRLVAPRRISIFRTK